YGVKVILTAVCFDTTVQRILFTNSTIKQNFFNNVKNKISQYQLDGVNVDFENVKTIYRGSVINNFMQELNNYIKQNLPGKEVSFASPAVNWGGWDFVGLANACDYLFIMGYDFYGSWSSTTGPSAPLTGGSYNITNTIVNQYSGVVNTNPQKLILGVPYYGNKWKTVNEQPHSQVLSYISSTRFRDDQPNSQVYGMLWASDNQTPWYRYQVGSDWYQVWYDNDSSLGLKYNLAQTKNLRGVGMWALGYDGSRKELWNELKKRFFAPSSVDLISPNGGEVFSAGSTQSVTWLSSNVNNLKIEYSTNGGASWIIISSLYPASSGNYQWTIPNISSNQCKVKVTNVVDPAVKDSTAGLFTIVPNVPLAPNLLSPVNGASNLSKTVTFQWYKSAGATRYTIQIAIDSIFSSLVINDTNLVDNFYFAYNLIDGKKYYWRVSARNEIGSSPFSAVWNFGTALSAPDSLKAENFSYEKVKLTWRDNSNSELGYLIERKNVAQPDYSILDTLIPNTTEYIDSTVSANVTYQYRVKCFNELGSSNYSNIVQITTLTNLKLSDSKVLQFQLKQNYPNPFNSSTIISFTIPSQSLSKNNGLTSVTLKIYNLLGKEVATLIDDKKSAGEYTLEFINGNLPSGTYLYKLTVGSITQTKKMIILK
ncbi:MAG: glycosyl hydrolase family 18 protein, partial [Ignavibacteria bacterium]|nr:glycosyl hydrolase family 18 protein [Ignavibacteria bacterium]